MVHSAAIWVYRALELIRAHACVKTPLDVAVGTNFTFAFIVLCRSSLTVAKLNAGCVPQT